MKVKNLISAFFLFALIQCTAPEISIKYYFDVQSQIEKKVSLLQEKPHQVAKSVLINGKEENNTIQMKNWEKELAMFLSLDLNRPALQGKYHQKDSTADKHQYKIYEALDEDISIRYLRVKLDTKDNNQLLGLYAQVSQENYLYQTSKILELSCSEQEKNRGFIQSYKIKGYEKILFQDKEQYVIKGSIID